MPSLYMSPSPKSFRRPQAASRPSSGIQRVVEELGARLPDRGWAFVDDPKAADVVASHACSLAHPDVLHCHGLYPTGEMNNAPQWTWEVNAKILRAVRSAVNVTVPSPWVAELFQRDMGFTPEIIRHGIDLSAFNPSPLETRSTSVLWNKNRPVDVCDPAPVNELATRLPRVHFVTTFGDRSKDNVEVTGTLSHERMMHVLSHAGVYLSSTRETYGIGVLEALALGVPVVSWNWGHVPNLIEHRKTGFIVEPYDYNGTVEAIQYCLENLEELSPNCQASVKQYDWPSVIDHYDAVYRSVLREPSGPEVSIVIPAYNYEEYIKEAIDSVKAQTRAGWECIVVNDGSTDGTLQAAIDATKGDHRFRIINQNNTGVAGARNRGVRYANGEYLTFLDADDRLRPKFLELLVPHLIRDRSLSLVYGKLEVFKGDEEPRVGPWPDGFDFNQQLRKKNQVPATNVMRMDAFIRTGGLRQRLAPSEDAALWTRMGMLGCKMDMVTKAPTYQYRLHDNAATSKIRNSEETEPNWAHPREPGFASLHTPRHDGGSHPVYNYDKPKVSVVIPVGDGHEDLLLDAIDSVVAQTRPEWEVIVVDDTSKGNLKDHGIIPYKDRFPFVRFLHTNDQNVARARNHGAENARGEYLLFLDADDILYKDFLAQTLPKAGDRMVYTDYMELPGEIPHEVSEYSTEELRSKSLFAVTFLHPKSAWEDCGGFDETLEGWEDWDYTINLALNGYCGLRIPQPLIGYRYQTGKRRTSSLANKKNLLKKVHGKWDSVNAVQCRPVPDTENGSAGESDQNKTPFPGLVEVEFLPDRRGARLYRTNSGTSYRFGSPRHKRKLVRQEDAEFFAHREEFRVNAPKRNQTQLELPGVPDAIVNLLAAHGWTLADLKGAFTSDLAALPQIDIATAERILDYADAAELKEPSTDETNAGVWALENNEPPPPRAQQRRPTRPRRRGG
ncbi:glycosyltransferase [bacterium]|nr:glycosyltransferase [bacterium]